MEILKICDKADISMLNMLWVWVMCGCVSAYLVGSLSSAIILSRVFGLPDPRTSGSGNPGATNVLRLSGKKYALMVFLGDFLKGLLPVLLAKVFFSQPLCALVGLFVVIGHIFPLYFQFKGGKGVATSAGVMCALSWPLGLSVIITWFLVAVIFRYSSLAAILSAIFAPFYAVFWTSKDTSIVLGIVSVIILIKHYDNIKKLVRGTESKIGQSSQ